MPIDLTRMREDVKDRIAYLDTSMRKVAEEMGLSPSTLERFLAQEGSPDLATVEACASWTGRRVADYEPPPPSTETAALWRRASTDSLLFLPSTLEKVGWSREAGRALVALIKAVRRR